MLNFIIKILSKFSKPIDGDPNEWKERQMKLPDGYWTEFTCGSCRGVYRSENREFVILAVQNTKKNNDFDKVLEWFDKSCKRYHMNLVFLEVGNDKLRNKLERLGFIGTKERMTKIY